MRLTIIKQNPKGKETWRYTGTVVSRGKNHIIIEAYFERGNMEIHGMRLCKGDRFIETYYFDRWYNIFEIHDYKDDHLKGFYCNISSPAVEKDGMLIYKDYALDLIVFPNGQQVLLDEDEFEAQDLSIEDRSITLAALSELQSYFKGKF